MHFCICWNICGLARRLHDKSPCTYSRLELYLLGLGKMSVSAPLANYTVNFGCHIFFLFWFWHHNSTHVSRPLAARMNKRGTETPARRPLQPNQPTAHTHTAPHTHGINKNLSASPWVRKLPDRFRVKPRTFITMMSSRRIAHFRFFCVRTFWDKILANVGALSAYLMERREVCILRPIYTHLPPPSDM